MRNVRHVLAVAVLAVATACTSGGPVASPTSASPSAPSPTVQGCRITPVHTGAVPSEVPGFSGSAGPPWMADDDLVAVLFYASGTDVVMRAGGWMAPNRTTKILWWVADAVDAPLVIHGKEAASGRLFTQRVGNSAGIGQYPSVVDVPAKGCWTLRATVAGSAVGAITIPVKAPA